MIQIALPSASSSSENANVIDAVEETIRTVVVALWPSPNEQTPGAADFAAAAIPCGSRRFRGLSEGENNSPARSAGRRATRSLRHLQFPKPPPAIFGWRPHKVILK